MNNRRIMKTSLAAALHEVAARQPDAPVIWYEDDKLTYAEFEEKIARVTAGFRKLGIGKGDRVSLWLPNTPAWLICFFALARLGAITLATNTRFRRAELKDILFRAGCKAIVYWPAYRSIDFEEVLRQVADGLPDLKHVIEYSEGPYMHHAPAHRAERGGATILEYAALEHCEPDSDNEDVGDATSPCLLYTTSGTTSKPKLVVHVQGTLVHFAGEVARAMGSDLPGASPLQGTPFCGTFGFVQAISTVLCGTPMALLHTFDAGVAARQIRHRDVTVAAVTDEILKRIYQHETETVPFPGIRFFVGSRAGELVGLAKERGILLFSGYGSSEVQALFSRRRDSDDPVVRASGGGVPVSAESKVRARNQETDEILPHGEAGEIEIWSNTMMTEYLGDTEATRKAFTDDGYFRTGDLGYTEADGSWTFLTRIGDAVRLSGFLVNPLEIEQYVRDYAGVALCCVVGVEYQGRTRVVAFYTTQSGQAVEEASLRSHCVEVMAHYKVPVRFVHVTELPMVASVNTAKVNRNDLRAKAAEIMSAAQPH